MDPELLRSLREAAPLLHHDAELARRLERAEGAANAAFVAARAVLQPELGATWRSIAGVYAMYDGVDSPLTQTFGLGLFDPVGTEQLSELEKFFEERGAPVQHEASPFLPPELLALLRERAYAPIEHSTVLVRSTRASTDAAPAVAVREIGADEGAAWSRIAAEGWSSESAELAAFVDAFGQVITRAEGVHCFLAELVGQPVAAAALSLHGGVALLAGASTIPSARRRGAQQALLEQRLRFARERGADLAMVVTAPGSASQRNAERQGFAVAYTRTKWQQALRRG